LTAALYASREGIEALVIERAAMGGQAATTEHLDNVPGFDEGIEGSLFGEKLRRQAERFGAELLQAQEVVRISTHDNYYCADTADGSQYSGCALLLATGSRYRRLGIPGEESYVGSGVHYCAACDGPFYKGLPVAVVGGGNSAAEESLFLVNYVDRVTLLARGAELKGSQVIREKALNHPQIDVRFRTEVTEFHGRKGKLTGVTVRNNQTGETEEIHPAAVFVFIGQSPNTAFLQENGIRLDQWGYILTGHDLLHAQDRPVGYENREPSLLETSIPGIFAAGDARAGSTKQVASASGEGATAALLIREYLKTT
jgi:thioredoxin reductase (NADPH)